jgi:hypothetical protein
VRGHREGCPTTHDEQCRGERPSRSEAKRQRDHDQAGDVQSAPVLPLYGPIPWIGWRICQADGTIQLELEFRMEPAVDIVVHVHT